MLEPVFTGHCGIPIGWAWRCDQGVGTCVEQSGLISASKLLQNKTRTILIKELYPLPLSPTPLRLQGAVELALKIFSSDEQLSTEQVIAR